jgi:cyclin C
LYLASKVEENTVQARLLVFYIKKMCGKSPDHSYIPMFTCNDNQ